MMYCQEAPIGIQVDGEHYIISVQKLLDVPGNVNRFSLVVYVLLADFPALGPPKPHPCINWAHKSLTCPFIIASMAHSGHY